MPRLNKSSVDVSQIFLTYCALVGDSEKVAAALDLDPDFVRKLAHDEGWQTKIERICLLSKAGRPGDFERAQNRALSFVQAHQVRELIGRVVAKFRDMTEEEVLEAISTVAKDGSRHVSARFFADLTASLEKAHALAYQALGDTAGERKDRTSDESDEINASALHSAVIAALNNPKINSLEVVAEVAKATDSTVKQLTDGTPPAL